MKGRKTYLERKEDEKVKGRKIYRERKEEGKVKGRKIYGERKEEGKVKGNKWQLKEETSAQEDQYEAECTCLLSYGREGEGGRRGSCGIEGGFPRPPTYSPEGNVPQLSVQDSTWTFLHYIHYT